MKEEKFKVINFIREFILLIESKMENFPKKEIELKNRIKIYAETDLHRFLFWCIVILRKGKLKL